MRRGVAEGPRLRDGLRQDLHLGHRPPPRQTLIHAQAQKLMKSSNYEEAAKQLFHAFNLEHDAREAAEKRAEEAEKRLRDNPAK